MTSPPPQRPPIPVAPLVGADWWAARAALAARRGRRFTRLWLAVLGPLTILALVVSFASRDPAAAARASRARLVEDTVRSAERLGAAVRSAAAAESSFTDAVSHVTAGTATPRVARAATPLQSTGADTAPSADPRLAAFEAAISEARRLRTPAAWLALSNESPVRDGPRMRALADSLTRLTQERDALASGPSRDRLAAPLTATINRLGYTIVAIAENRRRALASASGIAPAVAPPAAAQVEPEPERTDERPDTAALSALARAAQDTVAAAQRGHDAALAALQQADVPAEVRDSLAVVFPAFTMFLLLIGGLGVRFAMALAREVRDPTLAGALEAERAVGVPVLATVTDALPEGAARFRPSGVDPFRMLYLGLTSTGTRARTTIVTGSDPVTVAAVAARLAVSAAADHRTTLVMDVDPSSIALSRTFHERAEPGLTDALAGAFTWREIARPVGSSDGLMITLVPAGTERDDLPEGAALEAVRDDLTRFRAAFELTILVAPHPRLALALSLVESSPLLLGATVGTTPVAQFTKEGQAVKAMGQRPHGTVLWDAPIPELPSRAELAALLSKQKNRTPGGSFAAVKKAISGDSSNQ
jgi:Mrp family chromosome partitioning ATPase